MTAYLIKPSADNTLEVDIVNGEFGGIGVKFFNMDFSGIDTGEIEYEYQIFLKEELHFEGERKIRLEETLDDILSCIINDALKIISLRESNAQT